jgi:hypothetical protein
MDGKSLHYFPLIGLALVLSLSIEAQNRVPNSSFEENIGCPNNSGKIWLAEPWKSVRGSCDYHHECGTNGFGVPISNAGGGTREQAKPTVDSISGQQVTQLKF